MSTVFIRVDGEKLAVPEGRSLAAALFNHGVFAIRRSVVGRPRGVLCAMGVCFECRVTVDGVPHRRACMERCRAGMEVMTSG